MAVSWVVVPQASHRRPAACTVDVDVAAASAAVYSRAEGRLGPVMEHRLLRAALVPLQWLERLVLVAAKQVLEHFGRLGLKG